MAGGRKAARTDGFEISGGREVRLGQRKGGSGQAGGSVGNPPRILPVGGGKGGVGKSFLAANLAVSIARTGQRVVAVDCDLEGANLHTLLGLRRPLHSFAEFVAGRELDPRKLAESTPIENLRLISGTGVDLGRAQPEQAQRLDFLASLRQMDADFVILDLGAGSSTSVLDYFMVADDGLVVVAPEPTAVENAYTFMRAAFYRRLRLAMVTPEVRRLVSIAMDQRNESGIRSPWELLREVERLGTAEGAHLGSVMSGFRPRLVINGVRSTEDIRLGFSIRTLCKKVYAIDCEYLGYVSFDERAREAVRACRPIVEAAPDSNAAVYLRRIARKLAEGPRQEVS